MSKVVCWSNREICPHWSVKKSSEVLHICVISPLACLRTTLWNDCNERWYLWYEQKGCLACRGGARGKGGNCRQSNVTYEIECGLCHETDKSIYVGETSRNLYTRGLEHLKKYESGKIDSFLMKHQVEKHDGSAAVCTAKVTNKFKDCLSRQVAEGVEMRRCQANLMNTKTEWHQPPIWRIQSEILRG